MPSVDNNFRSDSDNLKWLLALLDNYGMYSDDISAISSIGYNVHVLNDMNENTAYVANQAKKETFVSTANYMDSLYKHAREVEIEPKFSKPASIDLAITILESTFIEKSISTNSNVRTYTISKDSFISVGNFIFSFDYDIEIKLEFGVGNDRYVTAKYKPGTMVNPLFDRPNNNIKVVRRVNDENEWYYDIYLNGLKQYHREITTVEFGDRDYGMYPIETKQKDSEIADISVYHINTGTENSRLIVPLTKKMYFDKSRTSEDSIFIRYDSFNRFTLIHKSQEGGFRPRVTDKLYTILYVTQGEAGNFQFSHLSGEYIQFHGKNDLSLRPVINLITGGSNGGKSFMDNKEMLRKNIITKRSTRNAISTENDLLLLLNNLNLRNEYYVIKNRNDILKVFNIFTLLKFNNQGITYTIPTNTLNFDWNYRKSENAIDLGDNFYQMTLSKATCTKPREGTLLTDTEFDKLKPLDLRYDIPFIVTFNRTRNIVRLYGDYMNKEYRTNIILHNDKVPFSYTCNWVRFNKNEKDQALKVHLQLRTNISGRMQNEAFFRITNPNTGEFEKTDFLNVYFILADENDAELYKVEMTMDNYFVIEGENYDDYYVFSADIIKAGKDNVRIKDDQVRLDDLNNPGSYIWVPIKNLKGRIEVHSFSKRSDGSEVLDIEKDRINSFPFECELLRNESTNFKIQHDVLDNDSIRIFYLPVIGHDFYKDHKEIYRQAVEAKDFLADYLQYFEGEFTYSLKYANTYGLSDLYSIGFNTEELIDNVILTMKFIIRYKLGSNLTEKELNLAVAKYIESINFFQGETLHISRLYDFLLQLYPDDIDLIQFDSINNLKSDKQYIRVLQKYITNRTVMEQLTLPIKFDELSGTFYYDIKWTVLKNDK